MNKPPPAQPAASGASPAPAANPDLEEGLHQFWEKNSRAILWFCAALVLAVLARQGWDYIAVQHEKSLQDEFARAGDLPDRLAAFAEANPDHPLAGIALLRVADLAFEKGDFKGAAASYQKAAAKLKQEVLLGRARLGGAMSQVLGGDSAAGEAALKAVASDPTVVNSIRAEATFHLASLAAEAGRADEALKLALEISKYDPNGTWSQRAMQLINTLPPPAAGAPQLTLTPGK